MDKDSLTVKFNPRKLNLDIFDISKMNSLFEGVIENDYQGKFLHNKGTDIHISHNFQSKNFGQLNFVSPNPMEFYFFGANMAFNAIKEISIDLKTDSKRVNEFIFWAISFFMFGYSGLEATVNSKIKNDISYVKEDKTYNKADIEFYFKLEDKIKDILCVRVGELSYWTNIKYFIKVRHSVVHLKSALDNKQEFENYDIIYKKLLDFNYEEGLINIKEIIKKFY